MKFDLTVDGQKCLASVSSEKVRAELRKYDVGSSDAKNLISGAITRHTVDVKNSHIFGVDKV